jgi:hypothetical protein
VRLVCKSRLGGNGHEGIVAMGQAIGSPFDAKLAEIRCERDFLPAPEPGDKR